MADVFLSYARDDQSWARLLASALESRGWSVWWDRRIPPGKNFNSYIEQQLADARCIVVLWSKHSIASTFVCDEAEEGRSDGRLVPVLIEAVRQPLGFRRFHAADLSDWQEGQPHEELDRLIESIRAIVPPFVVLRSAPIAAAPTTPPSPASHVALGIDLGSRDRRDFASLDRDRDDLMSALRSLENKPLHARSVRAMNLDVNWLSEKAIAHLAEGIARNHIPGVLVDEVLGIAYGCAPRTIRRYAEMAKKNRDSASGKAGAE